MGAFDKGEAGVQGFSKTLKTFSICFGDNPQLIPNFRKSFFVNRRIGLVQPYAFLSLFQIPDKPKAQPGFFG
jgi:hypothetical protein